MVIMAFHMIILILTSGILKLQDVIKNVKILKSQVLVERDFFKQICVLLPVIHYLVKC